MEVNAFVTLCSSPFLLLLVHRDSARTEGDHHKEAADDRKGLEEIVFEEVSHGLVGRDGPPGVEIEVEDVEPGHEHKGGQLGLVADSDEDHQQGADEVLDDLHGGHLESEEGQKHEDQEDPAGQLEIHLGLVLSQAGHASEQRLALHTALSEDEEEGSDEGEVTEQELEVPEDAVGYSLENHYEEENSTSDVHLEPGEDHGHGPQLAHQVNDDKHGGEEPATAP